MQKFIFKNKNKITLISGLLIILAFINHWFIGISSLSEVLLIIASIIGIIPIAVQAFGALKVKVISIDLLVTIAVIGAFIIKNYEESAVVSFLFLFGAYLEQRTLNKTRAAIKELTEMAPQSAFKQMENGEFEEVDIFDVDVDDILLVKTGAQIPVDGKVVFGNGYVNEASITGESRQIKKEMDSEVFAGTILENGTIRIKADKIGEDTAFGKIIELVEEAQDSKSEAERFIDQFSKYYTPAVLIFSIIAWIVTRDLEFAITILVLGCPGALVIGVPVSNVAGIGNGAKNGVLLKGSEVIRDFSRTDTMLFDKTGTLTMGKPTVDEAIFVGNNKEEIVDFLVSVERESDHPLAKSIVEEFKPKNNYKIENTHVVKGKGIVAEILDKKVSVGNISLMEEESVELTEENRNIIKKMEESGSSTVIMAIDKELKVILSIKDVIRPGIKENLQSLKSLGVKNLIMLSGDNQATVDIVSKELGLTKALGNMLPEDKSKYVEELVNNGKVVAFVGDGVNDSPSLALANVGIAMGGGTDVAIETSDVVLMNSDISKLPYTVGLTKAISNNMTQNIIIAVGTVIALIFMLIFTDKINMSIGMLVHEGSILVVILNGMRLLKYKLKRR